MKIPIIIINEIASIFSEEYTHSGLEYIFRNADSYGNIVAGNKYDKTKCWLLQYNGIDSQNSLNMLGSILEEYMERVVGIDPDESKDPYIHNFLTKRKKLHELLGQYGLRYIQGGHVYHVGITSSSHSLEQLLKSKNIPAIEIEFKRALDDIEKDPPASLTAACSIVESFCKVYIEEQKLNMPKEATIKPLWNTVSKELGFDPSRLEDNDLKKVLSGLFSIQEQQLLTKAFEKGLFAHTSLGHG